MYLQLGTLEVAQKDLQSIYLSSQSSNDSSGYLWNNFLLNNPYNYY